MTDEHPLPAFLRTCSDLNLVLMQHEARRVGDNVTLAAVLAELKRRAEDTPHA